MQHIHDADRRVDTKIDVGALFEQALAIGDDDAPVGALAHVLAASAGAIEAGHDEDVVESLPQRRDVVVLVPEDRQVGVVGEENVEALMLYQSLEDSVVLRHQQRLAAGELDPLELRHQRLELLPERVGIIGRSDDLGRAEALVPQS